ncbi:hypothetical protein HK414_24485 [Ramlibacter terrae]|uniref:Transcriptional regulator n=1 Tax=Ramlibacter terrae TaxID=2732511 RepID=A0ABX6P7P0_9BURK|nr:hypothetical protein HK414_24485 [Ramlibacter terrae]
MKQTPFVAFPLAEQEALLAVLLQAGVATRGFCASRIEWPDAEEGTPGASFALVTAAGMCRSYPADAACGWIAELQRDLIPVSSPA